MKHKINKKGISMPIVLIIGALIMLFTVAMVLIFFSPRAKIFSSSNDCKSRNGNCINLSNTECLGIISDLECSEQQESCCISLNPVS